MASKIIAKLYSSGTSTSDAVNIFTVPRAARLVAVGVYAKGTVTGALTENCQWELSLQSASQFTQAESFNVIAGWYLVPFVATAGSQPTVEKMFGGFDIPLEAGSKVYLHRKTGSALGGAVIEVILYFV